MTNTAFYRALKLVLAKEGGYVDHPADLGGPTNRGITQATYSAYLASKGLPVEPVRYATDEAIAEIYLERYWLAGRCDRMRERLAVAHFDACVHHGVERAAKLMQRALGVTEDGIVGPVTLRACYEADQDELLASYLALRRDLFRDIARRDATQVVFMAGWNNRVAQLERELDRMVA